MSISAFAADNATLQVDVSGDTAKNGEITVKLNLSDCANLGGLQAELSYDKTKLEFLDGKITDDFKNSADCNGSTFDSETDEGTGMAISFSDGHPSNYNGTIAEIKFKVLADGGEKIELGLTSEITDTEYNEMNIVTKPAEFIVKIPMTAINIEGETDRNLLKGESVTLTTKITPDNTTESNKTVKWTSSDETVAKVDENGMVTAIGGGKAVITAKTEVGLLTARININVNVNLTGIDIKSDTASIEEGKTLALSIASVPGDSTESIGTIEWISSDESIATVDNQGVVTAVKEGDVTITAKNEKFSNTIDLKVVKKAIEQQETNDKKEQGAINDEQKNDTKETKLEDNSKQETETTVAAIAEKKTATINDNVKTGDSANAGMVVIMFASIVMFWMGAYGKKFIIKK
jgi:uncharacterized protein YjdB